MKNLPPQPRRHSSNSQGTRLLRSSHSHLPPVTTYFGIVESTHRARELLTYAIGEAHVLLSHFVSECYDVVPSHVLHHPDGALQGRGSEQAERPPPTTSVFSHLLCVVFLKMSAEEEGEVEESGQAGHSFRMWWTDELGDNRQKDMFLALCGWCQQSVFLEEKEEGSEQSESDASSSSSEREQIEEDESSSYVTSESPSSSHHTDGGGDTDTSVDDNSNSSSSTRPYHSPPRALFSKTRKRGTFDNEENEDTSLLAHRGRENNSNVRSSTKSTSTRKPKEKWQGYSKNNSSRNAKRTGKGGREKGSPLRSVADNLSLALSHRFIVRLNQLFESKEKENEQQKTTTIIKNNKKGNKKYRTTRLAASLLDEALYQHIAIEIKGGFDTASKKEMSSQDEGDQHHSLRDVEDHHRISSSSHTQMIAQEALKLLSDALALKSPEAAAHFLVRQVLLPIIHRRSCDLRGSFQVWRSQYEEARRQRLASSFSAWKTFALDQYVVEERRRAELFLAGCVAALRRRRVKLRHQHASDRRLMRTYFDCWRYEGVPISLFERRSRRRSMQNVLDAMKFKRVSVMADRYHVMTLGKVALARWHEKLYEAHANRTFLHKCLQKMIDAAKVKRFKREYVVKKMFNFMRNRMMASRFRSEKERNRMAAIYLSDVSSDMMPRVIAGNVNAPAHTLTQSQQLVVGGTTDGEAHARALGIQGPKSPTFSNVLPLPLSASRPSNLTHALLLQHTHRKNASTAAYGEEAANVKKALILSKWRRELDKRIAIKKDANRLGRLVHKTLSMRLEEREKILIAKKNSDRLQLLGVIRKWRRAALSDVPRERRLAKTCEAYITFNCFSKWQERLRKRRERREAEVLCERYSCQSLKGKLFRKWQRRLWAERATRAYHTQREFHTKIACLFTWHKRYATVSTERKKSEEVAEILSEKLALKHALQTWQVALSTRRRLLFPVEYANDEAAQVEDASIRLLKGFAGFGGDKGLSKESGESHSDFGLNRSNVFSLGRGGPHNNESLDETSSNGFKTEIIISDADLMAGGALRREIFFAAPVSSQKASFHSSNTASKKSSAQSRVAGETVPLNPSLSRLCSLRDADRVYLRRLALKAVVCWVAALRLQKYRQAKKQKRRMRGQAASSTLTSSVTAPTRSGRQSGLSSTTFTLDQSHGPQRSQRMQEDEEEDASIHVRGRKGEYADSFSYQYEGRGVSRTANLSSLKEHDREKRGGSRASTGIAATTVATTAADGYRVVHVDGAKATPFSLLSALKFHNESQQRRHHKMLFPQKENEGVVSHPSRDRSNYTQRSSETFGCGEGKSRSDNGRRQDWESEDRSQEGGRYYFNNDDDNDDDDEYYDEDNTSNAGDYYTTTNASIIEVEVV